MSDCINRYSSITLLTQFLPLILLPLLFTHCGWPSLYSLKERPKFSAGTTCSHSILLALFLCFSVKKPFEGITFFLESNFAAQ
jgi:hypothetical protein